MRAPATPRQPARPSSYQPNHVRSPPPAGGPARSRSPRKGKAVDRPATDTVAQAAPDEAGSRRTVAETGSELMDARSGGGRVVATSGAPRVTGRLVDRIAEKRAAHRRLRTRLAVWAAVAAVLLASLVYLVFYSPVLALHPQDVQITGTSAIVSDAQVRAMVDARADEPLAGLDTGALADEIRGLVGVRDVVIVRAWPTGLTVTIDPRLAVANVATDDGFALLDVDGVELARTPEATPGVPVVSVPVGEESTAASLEAVLTVLSSLPPDLLARVSSAGALTPDQVTFELDRAEVVWGSAEESGLKASVLATLLQVPASVYDVSAPLTPITR